MTDLVITLQFLFLPPLEISVSFLGWSFSFVPLHKVMDNDNVLLSRFIALKARFNPFLLSFDVLGNLELVLLRLHCLLLNFHSPILAAAERNAEHETPQQDLDQHQGCWVPTTVL